MKSSESSAAGAWVSSTRRRHRRLNRLVALKMIRGGMHADDIQITRFKIEAEAVAALHHPNILQIYDIGESDGLPYVALELLEGGSLLDRLRGTLLAPRQAAEWMVPMAMAMDAAHRAGIVHRDLKSANILFSSDHIPKITDFGLAKRLETEDGETHTGQVMGTPSYMAPEQARGDTKSAGPPADIYALGAILYEMLTGRPPFKGVSAMDTVKQVIEVEPVSPSRVQYRVPRDLETICLKCLQKEPRKRYATAKEMADDLNRYLFGEPIRARRTPPIERAVKWSRRHQTAATLLALGIVGSIGLSGYGVRYWNNQRALQLIAQRHEAEVQKATNDDLLLAQEDISRNDLDHGKVVLTARQKLLEVEPKKSRELTALYDRTRLKLGEIERALAAARARRAEQLANDAVQERYRLFLDRRTQALLRDTEFPSTVPGLEIATKPDLTRKAAEEALGVFAQRGNEDDWKLGDLPAALSKGQQAEVTEGSYELLLVLAEAMAAQEPGKVDRALRILESADRLRPTHSRALSPEESVTPGAAERSGGRGSRARRGRAHPPRDCLRSLPERAARVQAPSSTRRDPGLREHLANQARSLLGPVPDGQLLYPDVPVRSGKVVLDACLQTDPGVPMLYLLRSFASGQLGVKYLSLIKVSPGRETALKASAEFEFNEAELDINTALERLKSTPDEDLHYVLLLNRGYFRFQRGHIGEAAAAYQEAIGLKEDSYRHMLSWPSFVKSKAMPPRRSRSSRGQSPSSPTGRRSTAAGPR